MEYKGQKCTRTSGKNWRCPNLAIHGKLRCEKHQTKKKKASEQSSNHNEEMRNKEDLLEYEGNANFTKNARQVKKRDRIDKQRRVFNATSTSTLNLQKEKYVSIEEYSEPEDDDCVVIFNDEDLGQNMRMTMGDYDIDPNIAKYISQKAEELRLSVNECIQSKAILLHEELSREIKSYRSNCKISAQVEQPFFKRCLEQWKHTYISSLLESYTKKTSKSLSTEIGKLGNYILRREDLLSLHPTGCLSLGVIRAYATLITKTSKRLSTDLEHNMLIADPSFYRSLQTTYQGNNETIKFDSVFTVALGGFMEGNLTQKEVVIPVNLCDCHWGLIVVDMYVFTITILDPKFCNDEVTAKYHDAVKVIAQYLSNSCGRSNEADGEKQWTMEHPGCQIVGETMTTDHHEELIKMGIKPLLKGQGMTQKFPYVIFCAPPSRTPDYPGDVRLATASWNGEGSFVFTSSSAPYDCFDNGSCDEDSPVVSIGKSPRTDVLLKAEKEVLEAGGCVVRLAGLYKSDRGAHVYWLEKGVVEARPDHILNLIHYEDAASLAIAILMKKLRGQIFVGCDNHPVSRQDVMDLVEKSGKFSKKFQKFTGTSDPLGKKLNNSKTRAAVGWEPKYPSFAAFLGIHEE